MRGTLRAVGLVVALTGIGCHHDKYNVNPKHVEEYIDPPHQPNYDEPDRAGFRKPPPPKDEKSLMGKPPGMGPGMSGL